MCGENKKNKSNIYKKDIKNNNSINICKIVVNKLSIKVFHNY